MPPPAPRTVTEIRTEITALATAHPSVCTEVTLPNNSQEGRSIRALRITAGPAGAKPVALVVGGLHAREWAPPDALLTFAQKLVAAYAGGVDAAFPAFTDTTAPPPIPYAAFKWLAADVKKVVETLDIYVVPVANPDGRHFTLAAAANDMWRKNRRPHPSGGASIGVDLNRNFDVAWDIDVYYNATASGVRATKTRTDDLYIGDSAASEPETQNVAWLIDNKRVAYFCDVHSAGRLLMHPWAMETVQTTVPTKTFTNASWNRGGPLGGRDGTPGSHYEEFMSNAPPAKLLDDHVAIATAMKDAILAAAGADATARARSTYRVGSPATTIGYLSPGSSTDYAFSRPLVGSHPSVRAIAIECGSRSDGENGFHPPYATKYPKIEREVNAALFAFLTAAVARSPAPAAPAPPAAPASSGPCLFTIVLMAAGLHSELARLRATRDRMVTAPGVRGRVGCALHRLYRRAGARPARYLERHPGAREVARVLLVMPVTKILTAFPGDERPAAQP